MARSVRTTPCSGEHAADGSRLPQCWVSSGKQRGTAVGEFQRWCRSRAAITSRARWCARSRRGNRRHCRQLQKRCIHPLDINPTVLHGFDAIRNLDELARGGIGIGEGTSGHEFFHAATRSSLSAHTSQSSARHPATAVAAPSPAPCDSTSHGPSVPCRSPSSLCGLALASRASRRSPQHPKCKGKAAKTHALALDPR